MFCLVISKYSKNDTEDGNDGECVSQTFHPCDKYLRDQLKGGRIYFGSQF
jgi:hypothetical protein